ncbi:caspase domain-containing protein [Mycena galericulata]|nr:caspase domain-containing protein [Mycena galericulata]
MPEQPPAAPVPKKKALLIGISHTESGTHAPQAGAHEDVLSMRKLLIEQYGYVPADIMILVDSDEGSQPTRVNILRAIDDLVDGARKEDRFFFYYCGRTSPVHNMSNSEEDGLDECLVPLDGEHKIKDTELSLHLVDPLPIGSSLVAVFDSCSSASLLDLAHFRCNRVYVPWIYKTRRRRDEIWDAVVRRNALTHPLRPLTPPTTDKVPIKNILKALSFNSPHSLGEDQQAEGSVARVVAGHKGGGALTREPRTNREVAVYGLVSSR